MARFLSYYRSLSGKRSTTTDASASTSTTYNIDDTSLQPPEDTAQVDRLGALEELLFGESDYRSNTSFIERGRLRFSEGDSEILRLFFTRMQARNSNFFSVFDLDEDGCVRNVFWADARSRASAQYYNDVVVLDTSYIVNKYDLPLAVFVGANHHCQPVLLGCCLLSDETTETYVWLLKAWIACMSGIIPGAVISDQCKGIQTAVAEVLPGVRHRVCLWQVMKRVPENLGGLVEYRAINKLLQKAVYDSLRPEEFEDDWRMMLETYGLFGNEWLVMLYENKYSWVPVFLKDTFWAGMSTTQRNETYSSYFDGYVDSKTSLKQFISKYEMALQSKFEKEAQADFETFHKRRPAVSKFYMEEQLCKVYTLNMFKKFQDEIEAIMYCHASAVTVDGPLSTFDVKECIFLEDGKRTMNKNYGVLYNTEERDVQCICGSFQFRGILCRHALSVLKLQQVHEIPVKYVLDRWKKDYKRLHVASCSSNDVIANTRADRYDYLTKRCLQLVEVGVVSDKYRLALNLIREAEKFLLSDNTYEDTKPKIVARIPKTNRPERINNQNIWKTFASQNGNDGRRVQQPLGKESKGSLGKSKESSVSNASLPGSNVAVPMNPQQFIGNQTMRSVVYMFPGALDPQMFGNAPMMPWLYQQMLQASQQPDAAPGARQAVKRRKIYRGRKPVESVQETQTPPGPCAS